MVSASENPSPHPDDDSIDDPTLTELVAYLDGELPPEDSEKLEQQLAVDAPLRRCADSLDRTWQMLDALEEAPASGEFTRRTLSCIQAQSNRSEPATSRSMASRVRAFASQWSLTTLLLWTLAGFCGTGAGLLLSRQSEVHTANPDDAEILRSLTLLQDYQSMRQIPDTAFLKKLAELPATDFGSTP